MRHIAILIIATLISTIASAYCDSGSIHFLSKNRSLNRNGLLVLHFYGYSQKLIPDLNKKYYIYLQSEKGKVPLNVIEVLKGEFRETEVVLKPSTILKGDKNYEFKIDSLPDYEAMPYDYDEELNKRKPIVLRTTNLLDKDLPLLKDIPVEFNKNLTYFGCGPAISVSFKIKAEDKSELFVRAKVKNAKTGETTDYILKIVDGEVSIGHDMCSGAFNLEKGGDYEVSFCLIDQSGNKTTFTKPIHFTAPTDSDKSK